MPKIKLNIPDDEPDSLLRPCFQIGDDVELKEIPSSGEEYLLKVITERRNVLEVTKCDVDLSKFYHKQSRFVREIPLVPVPEKFKPTIEWQNIQVADFSDVRMDLSRVRNNLHKLSAKIEPINIVNETLGCWKRFFNENKPKLTCVLGLKESQIDKGLERLTEIIETTTPGGTIDNKIGQWVYALLACLKVPLVADSHSIIRTLARKCAEKRSHIDPEKEDALQLATPFSLFICLVAKYFGQSDLAD